MGDAGIVRIFTLLRVPASMGGSLWNRREVSCSCLPVKELLLILPCFLMNQAWAEFVAKAVRDGLTAVVTTVLLFSL